MMRSWGISLRIFALGSNSISLTNYLINLEGYMMHLVFTFGFFVLAKQNHTNFFEYFSNSF